MTPTSDIPATRAGQTAAAHMVDGIPRATAVTPVREVLRILRGQRFACADTIFVVDADGHLEGIVRINDLLADGDHCLGDIMEEEHEAVRADADQEQIAMLAIALNMIAVPVVDESNRLIGAVPPEALFRILRDEHMEDLQRLAGIAPHAEGPEVAFNAPLRDRYRRRLPWLIFGLAASAAVTSVMAAYEEAFAADAMVAFFVPALVYIAGAIGTQAVSVAVRGLADEDVQIGSLLRDELLIGLAVGATLGTLSGVAVHLAFDHPALALAVGLAVLGGGAVSAVVGFGLPWLFRRFGADPALGSGPICTIVQDVASLFIYFVLVTLLVL
ncbi:MAG: magnesium transporter [Gammaproteobacteria bacterium]